MGTPFNMKGSSFYGKGNQSPAPQIGRVPQTRAPQAASLDYVNPVENSSPVEQVQAKQELGAAGNAAANKAEMYAKRAQGPIEQRSMTPPPGWRAERTAPSPPAAPAAASLDYVNPVEGSSPASQISAQNAKERATANINKTEAMMARGSGPIEQKKKKKKK